MWKTSDHNSKMPFVQRMCDRIWTTVPQRADNLARKTQWTVWERIWSEREEYIIGDSDGNFQDLRFIKFLTEYCGVGIIIPTRDPSIPTPDPVAAQPTPDPAQPAQSCYTHTRSFYTRTRSSASLLAHRILLRYKRIWMVLVLWDNYAFDAGPQAMEFAM